MRYQARHGGMGIAAVLGVLSLVACRSAEPTEKVGAGQSMLTEGACMSEELGSDTSCKGIDHWKEFAVQACQNRGLALADLTPGAACEGGVANVKYSCCKAGPQPIPPRDGKPDGAPACFADAQGGPAACKPAEEWTKLASDLCGEKGSSLAQVAFADECARGSFRFTKYVCCDATKPPPPPPRPPVCFTEKLDPNLACVDPGALKERAFELCAVRKLVLTDLGFDGACQPDGNGGAATVTCCEQAHDDRPVEDPPKPDTDPREPNKDPDVNQLPPNPDGTACFDRALVEQGCIDDGTLKELAAKTCAEAGAALSTLAFSNDCGDRGSTTAKFKCCENVRP